MTIDGLRIGDASLRMTKDEDMPFVMSCMKESVCLSADPDDIKHSDLWIDGILSMTQAAVVTRTMNSEAFILEKDKEKIGMLWMGISRDQYTCEEIGYILEIFVAEKYRGRGIGSAMIDAAEQWCSEHGLVTLALDAGVTNTAAISLYRKRGFNVQSYVMRKRPGINE